MSVRNYCGRDNLFIAVSYVSSIILDYKEHCFPASVTFSDSTNCRRSNTPVGGALRLCAASIQLYWQRKFGRKRYTRVFLQILKVTEAVVGPESPLIYRRPQGLSARVSGLGVDVFERQIWIL